MNRIKKKWRKWFAIPLAMVLVAGTVLGVQMTRQTAPAYASNVAVTNTALTGQVASTHTLVQFDMSWDYSWRDLVNWDAVWVFVKYRVDGGSWAHATLSTTSGDHSITSPADFTVEAVGDGKGVLIYRTGNGSGTATLTGVKLRWNYGSGGDGVADDALVEGKVFAIEMVYIPEYSFWVGDVDNSPTNSFRAGGTTGPLQITSEGAITVDDVNATSLYYDGGSDYDNIPGPFPKGYNDFYMMKYEVSQGQYAEFLNTLTPAQGQNRFIENTGTNRQYIELVGVYGNDASGNNVLNESDDGEWVAANHLAWADAAAYADWAGLRPMTELEFEKAARGNQAVVDDEYVWGNANIAGSVYTLSNAQQAGEVINANYATGSVGNAMYTTTEGAINGPLRVGIFATDTATRIEAGASYYGVMELSGNLWERPVTVGNATGRAFTGLHGDGALDAAGDADVTNWPGTDAVGSGLRGGHWAGGESLIRLSSRNLAAEPYTTRGLSGGFRGVRTAP